MEMLKRQRRFDFLYGGKPFAQLDCTVQETEDGNTLTTVYTLPDGLKVTNVATRHANAYEWCNWFENTSDSATDIISQLWDCSVVLPLRGEDPPAGTAQQPEFGEVAAVYAPAGSAWKFDEFSSFADRKADNTYLGHLPVGATKEYAPRGARSSDGSAPFFNVHSDGAGYIFAIGWTGQWNCRVSRTRSDVIIQTRIEDTHFRLLPGEKIRTSSVVLMPYEGSVVQSQNMWRRLVKDCFSLIGKPGRDEQGLLCASVWGGMKSQSVLERIKVIRDNAIPFEYIWMDAGWYGSDTQPTPDEFEGDWWAHTGDWQVSPAIHPDKLRDVSAAVHEAGMKFLLWFEPERVLAHTPIAAQHPEYFLYPENPEDNNRLLNLGNAQAWEYCYETLSSLIEEIGIDCYRQDFNFEPLSFFRRNDAPDRQGISEIKHITGMYRLWDALLERFPHLMIDNCASGGRRIDIETLRRSIPLWRTDYACPANYPSEGVQCHHLSFNNWMPFSGTGTGRSCDVYRIRSAYSPALNTSFAYSEHQKFGDDPEQLAWIKKYVNEYLKVRPLMNEDFYPLTEVSDRKDVWSAAQFDRPSHSDGMVQVFRRENSPYETAVLTLGGIDRDAAYIFTDADDDSTQCIRGEDLASHGFTVTLKEKRTAKIYFYEKRR